jgi:hypothetical protein
MDKTVTTTESREMQDRKLLLSLMLISTFYIIFMMPSSVSFTYILYLQQDLTQVDPYSLELLYYYARFCDTFSMLNFCLNFIIYGSTLPFYQEEFWNMFKPKNRERV